MWSGHSTCTTVVRVNFKDFLTPAALYLSDTVIYLKYIVPFVGTVIQIEASFGCHRRLGM